MNIEPMHIVPENDLREHITSKECWCKPVQDEELLTLFIHNSLDRRELYEDGERKLS